MAQGFDRSNFEETLKQRFFFAPAYEIYGGVGGLYDYGPIGCAIKANVLALWRNHFVLAEGMLEIDCPSVTPRNVLQASGHEAKFADIMVRDMVTGECLRADHYLEEVMTQKMQDPKATEEQVKEYKMHIVHADCYTKEQLVDVFGKYQIHSPKGNKLSPPADFNMMFPTSIGPTGDQAGFLRPETAQGIFLAFKRLYEFNNQRLPFAGAQIGVAYRNEIAPKNGLLRVREFTMAEIEYFVDPTKKDKHHKFQNVADLVVPLLSQASQVEQTGIMHMRLGDAVEKGLIANENLGYFLGRTFLFMQLIGVDMERFRFRQHLPKEMAHYAQDCWDVELETSLGWIECVGCADRSCYDLDAHTKASKVALVASERLDEPITRDVVLAVPQRGIMGKAFKKANKPICDYLGTLSNEEVEAMEAKMQADKTVDIIVAGQPYTLEENMVTFERKTVTEHERKFTPSVIEPSFGVGRIIYALLEHNFKTREGSDQRRWFSLPTAIAPVKCALLGISKQAEFDPFLQELVTSLTDNSVSCRVDDSGAAIGKKYARLDEIAIPFAVTVDFDTLKDRTATLRERNTMSQIRLPLDDIAPLLAALASGRRDWEDAVAQYGLL